MDGPTGGVEPGGPRNEAAVRRSKLITRHAKGEVRLCHVKTAMKRVAEFSIEFVRFLDENGAPQSALPPGLAEKETLVAMYRLMALTRALDAKAIALQRTGQLGTYASCLGQEAVGAGVGFAMRPEDVLVPSYREQAAQLARGVTPAELLLYWGGDERGSDFSGPRHDFPIAVPIGTQTCHAVGAAAACKLRGEARAVVSCCGDGATSKGDFYESINLAGVWRLPVVFVVVNNQWAISVPRRLQSGAETLAQKAIAGGFEGLQVDGNDPLAVRWSVDRALAKARDGGGPTLIEALTYRIHDHTTADDASRYRSEAEVEAARARDPLLRTRRYLDLAGYWSDDEEAALKEHLASVVQEAVDTYLATPPPGPEAMFDCLFARLPGPLARQRARALGTPGDG
jgi:pyruvate dehydrogenase E1 component alpha subunit